MLHDLAIVHGLDREEEKYQELREYCYSCIYPCCIWTIEMLGKKDISVHKKGEKHGRDDIAHNSPLFTLDEREKIFSLWFQMEKKSLCIE